MVNRNTLYAVITGDLVGSSEIDYACRKAVLSYMHDSFRFLEKEMNLKDDILLSFEIFRGDSFQAVLNPQHALLASVILYLKLGIFDRKGADLSVRISIGIGSIDYLPESGNIGEADGMAFRLSGKALDSMKKKDQYLLITSPDPALDLLFESQCAFFDLTASRWTDIQKEILLGKLSGLTQEEIAAMKGKTQSSVSQSLKAAGFDAIKTFLDNYESLFAYPGIFMQSDKNGPEHF